MNQKEYELIGNTIHLTYDSKRNNPERQQGIKDIALDLAYRFAKEYANFDRDKFLKGCGIAEI